jgi:hypothetical protein
MSEYRAITTEDQLCLLHTSETPGYRLLCDLIQSEVDNTLTLLESFDTTEVQERRYLGYIRALRKILALMIVTPKTIQQAIRKEIDPNSTDVLFKPGVSDGFDVDAADLWPQEEPLAPRNSNNTGVVVE